MLTILLATLAIAYIVLKVINTRAEFAAKDAERLRQEQEAEAAMEEEAEEEEIRAAAVDVEAETIDAAEAEEPAEEEAEEPAEEEAEEPAGAAEPVEVAEPAYAEE